MRTLLLTLVILAALAAPTLAHAGAPAGPYRTDAQAERYLEATRGGDAFCFNGYYSRHEQRTGRHFPELKVVTPRGYVHYKASTFRCSLSDDIGTRQLYLQTRPHGGWVVLIDR